MNRKEELFLAGGGDKEDSKAIDDYLVRRVNETGLSSIAYIPLAMTSRSYSECLAWFRSVFEGRIENIQMWDKLTNISVENMMSFGAIYIGGGNTVTLWQHIQGSGFDEKLRQYTKKGGTIYGGSAGAIILGKDLRTAPEARKEQLNSYDGLNILGGYSVFCHYDSSSKHAVEKLIDDIGSPIIAIPENSGVVRSEKKLLILGSGSVDIFTDIGVKTLPPSQIE
jgi:dipeptidase E